MSPRDNPRPFNWRSHPRPSPTLGEPEREWEYNPEDHAAPEWQGPLYQGIRFDPEQGHLFEHGRAFHPKAQPRANHELLAYVDGMNA